MKDHTHYRSGPWVRAAFCTTCNHMLTLTEACHNLGVCPYCGASSGETMAKFKPKTVRWVELEPRSLWQRLLGLKGKRTLEEKGDL